MKHTSFKPDRNKIKLRNLPARVLTVLTSAKSDMVELDPHFTALDVSERQKRNLAALYRNVLANRRLICTWNIVVDGKCSVLQVHLGIHYGSVDNETISLTSPCAIIADHH